MRSPLDAEPVVVDVVRLDVGHVEVDCRGRSYTFHPIKRSRGTLCQVKLTLLQDKKYKNVVGL